MKKLVYLLLAACVSLLSCSKNDSDNPTPEQKSTPAVSFKYSQNDLIKAGMTMVLTVDGKEYKFDKDSDEQVIKITASSGTIKFECKVDESKTYTEKQDVLLSVNINTVSIPADGKGYSTVAPLVNHTVTAKGMKADAVKTNLLKYANLMNVSKNYKVDSSGKISLQ